MKKITLTARKRRANRVRAKVSGTATRPRLAVFRSNTNIYAQLIDDLSGKTLVSASDVTDKAGTKTDRAKKVGAAIAAGAKSANLDTVVFDRAGYQYAGRVKALAEGAREAGLKF